MMAQALTLVGRHTRYTTLRLLRAGMALTVLSALAAVALLVLVLSEPEGAPSRPDSISAILGVAMLAAMASAMVHTVIAAADSRGDAWEDYVSTLPGYRFTRALAFLAASCGVGMLASIPVVMLGMAQDTELTAATWPWLVPLVPVSAVPGVLLGLLVARLRVAPLRYAALGLVLLGLIEGALVSVGTALPTWAEVLSYATPTFAATQTLTPILSDQPISTPHLLVWVFWCLTPLLLLFTLDRLRNRSLT